MNLMLTEFKEATSKFDTVSEKELGYAEGDF